MQGGRQAKGGTAARGGGYLDVCTTSKLSSRVQKKFARDPRLDTLRKMGMHHTWQKVAAEIGMDAFLAMWRILDAEEQFQHEKSGLEINLRRYRSYTKFQRNEYIRQLADHGLQPREINEKLQAALSESLNPSHISNIIKND